MRVLIVDEDDSLRGFVDSLAHEIGCPVVAFASLDEVAEIARAHRRRQRAEVVVLDVDAPHAELARRRVATAFPRALVFAIANGDYEATLTEALARDRRRTRAAIR